MWTTNLSFCVDALGHHSYLEVGDRIRDIVVVGTQDSEGRRVSMNYGVSLFTICALSGRHMTLALHNTWPQDPKRATNVSFVDVLDVALGGTDLTTDPTPRVLHS